MRANERRDFSSSGRGEREARGEGISRPAFAPTDHDLPFPGPAVAEPDGLAALDRPLYLGSLTVNERSGPGPLSLDLLLDLDRATLTFGPFTLTPAAAARLATLLRVVRALLPPAPRAARSPLPQAGEGPGERAKYRPEAGRGIAGWDLARTLAEIDAAGAPWEGETRP